jgi:hypothetical protein
VSVRGDQVALLGLALHGLVADLAEAVVRLGYFQKMKRAFTRERRPNSAAFALRRRWRGES